LQIFLQVRAGLQRLSSSIKQEWATRSAAADRHCLLAFIAFFRMNKLLHSLLSSVSHSENLRTLRSLCLQPN
jgi:hypothetical protein